MDTTLSQRLQQLTQRLAARAAILLDSVGGSQLPRNISAECSQYEHGTYTCPNVTTAIVLFSRMAAAWVTDVHLHRGRRSKLGIMSRYTT